MDNKTCQEINSCCENIYNYIIKNLSEDHLDGNILKVPVPVSTDPVLAYLVGKIDDDEANSVRDTLYFTFDGYLTNFKDQIEEVIKNKMHQSFSVMSSYLFDSQTEPTVDIVDFTEIGEQHKHSKLSTPILISGEDFNVDVENRNVEEDPMFFVEISLDA